MWMRNQGRWMDMNKDQIGHKRAINNRQRGARWWTLKVYFHLWWHQMLVVIHRKWGQACHHWKWPTRHRIWDQVLCHAFKDRHSTYIATMWISRQTCKKLSPKLNNSNIIIHFISFPLKFIVDPCLKLLSGFDITIWVSTRWNWDNLLFEHLMVQFWMP
jgi:hypothetical protein